MHGYPSEMNKIKKFVKTSPLNLLRIALTLLKLNILINTVALLEIMDALAFTLLKI